MPDKEKALNVYRLINELNDKDWMVRQEAVFKLSLLGYKSENVEKYLINALSDYHWRVRKEAAHTLGKLWIDKEKVKDALLKALNDHNRDVKAMSA